jgi:polyene glycosyltransferase
MYALFAAVPLIGHLNPLIAQAAELQRRGWRVAIATFGDVRPHVARENPDLPFVDLGPLGSVADVLRRTEDAACRDRNFARGAFAVVRALNHGWLAIYDGVTATVARDRPDVMVVDLFTGAALCAAERADVPVVINNADLLASIPVTLIEPADNVPFMFSGRSIRAVGFGQRLAGPFLRRLAAFVARVTLQRDLDRFRAERGLPATAIADLVRDRTMIINSVFGVEYDRPLPPWVHMVGPMMPSELPALPADLAGWIADGPPVVYANLGTLATASSRQLAATLDALSDARFRALWVLRDDQAARLPRRAPASVRIMPWCPSPVGVLAHANTRVFVSHCGTNSVHESLAVGTPIVGIPMFADQLDWAVRVADAGAGVWLDKSRFGAEELNQAIGCVLSEPSFTQSMPRLQRAFADAGGVRRAADIIEREPGRRR